MFERCYRNVCSVWELAIVIKVEKMQYFLLLSWSWAIAFKNREEKNQGEELIEDIVHLIKWMQSPAGRKPIKIKDKIDSFVR